MDIIWKPIVLVLAAVLLLRLSGKKSISEMTIASTVIMISIGEIIVFPVLSENVFHAIGTVAAFLGVLLLLEWSQLKWNRTEKLFTGTALPLVENGLLVERNMKNARLTVDNLEMRLREKGIARLSDVKTVTLEISGQLGYELTEDAKPITTGEFKRLLEEWRRDVSVPALATPVPATTAQSPSLFAEVLQGRPDEPMPDRLH